MSYKSGVIFYVGRNTPIRFIRKKSGYSKRAKTVTLKCKWKIDKTIVEAVAAPNSLGVSWI